MAIKGVLFDFSGTLFRIEPAEDWLRATADALGVPLTDSEAARAAAALERAGALPGGALPVEVAGPHGRGWGHPARGGGGSAGGWGSG
ncbi:hydrolase, partial [Streptomyces sp. NPDC005898]